MVADDVGHAQAEGGERVKPLELWRRDPVACVRELIGNPAFRTELAYAPEKAYADRHGRTRRYDEMWTGDWWWETQVSVQLMSCQAHTL